MKLYVYCLAEKIDELPAPVSGISGARVDLIKVEGFSLLVSEFGGEAALVTRENVVTHDNVVRSLLTETTPLPFRFGTVVPEHQLASYLRTHRPSLEKKLAQVRDCVEMSVKIISNPDQAEIKDDNSTQQGPGLKFLREKQREILGGERRAEQAKEVSEWLQEQVRPFIRDEQVSLCPTEKLIVAAAHLVAREQVGEYRDRLAAARKMRSELHFLSSGPWPPYTFSIIELEFKTRFGVS
jgi:hypothetical protein